MRQVSKIIFIAVLTAAPVIGATIGTQTGDIVAYVNAIPIPGAGSQAFIEPSNAASPPGGRWSTRSTVESIRPPRISPTH